VIATLILGNTEYADGLTVSSKWKAYKQTFHKNYTQSIEEKAFTAFIENDRIIEEHNAKDMSYTLGHNSYSDITWEAFKKIFLADPYSVLLGPKDRVGLLADSISPAAEDSIDWVSKGAVTTVKDQGQCGDDWAFSAAGAFEGAFKIATGTLLEFSIEQLENCDSNGTGGCSGGLISDNAFKWIKDNGGICTAADYNNSSGTVGACRKCHPAGILTGYTDVPAGDEDALKSAVGKTPVSVAIEADSQVFQLYSGGVLSAAAACGKQVNHMVLTVGYGTDDKMDYWRVKNSWGTSWGEGGYFRLMRGVNCCGIASFASYPTGVHAI